jgi:hypothetical protein
LGLFALPLLMLSFPFFWQARSNYAEPLAFALLFGAILTVIYLFQQKKPALWLAGLALFYLLNFTFVRVEGLLILILAVILIYFKFKTAQQSFFTRTTNCFLGISTLLLISYFVSITPFFEKLIKDLIDYAPGRSIESEATSAPAGLEVTQLYLTRVFLKYQLLPLIILGLIQIFSQMIQFFKTRKPQQRKKLISQMIPIFLAGPFLIYFLKPMISLDHPWLLRRFMFAVWPLLVLSAVVLIHRLSKKTIPGFAFLSLLVAWSLLLFFNYGFIRENTELTRELARLSQQFSEKDLILVDKSTAPDSWSLISAPLRFLFAKNAVYIYNPADISKIKATDFDSVYLLTAPDHSNLYQDYLDLSWIEQNFQLNFLQLNLKEFDKTTDFQKPVTLPQLTRLEKEIEIYKIKISN